MSLRPRSALLCLTLAGALACSDDGGSGGETTTEQPTSSGDGDPSTGDGDGDPSTGDGDGNPSTGDGDSGCPESPCNPDQAGYCGEGAERVVCEQDTDGCWVPTNETVTCADSCVAGACCNGDGEIGCECVSNPCLDNGFDKGHHCLPDGQTVQCNDLFGCMAPTNQTPDECPAEQLCVPETGTCGGCNPDDECFQLLEGFQVCLGNGQAATCAVVDGCTVSTEITQCGNACFYGTGCCGVAGEPCCPQGTDCFDGSACVDDMCQ